MSNDLSDTGKLTILIVENSRTARAVLQALLVKSGFFVETVPTGPEALEFLEKNHADLIVMDVFMPLMNGYEVSNQIRGSKQKYADIPIIGYSSSKSSKDESLCLEAGMSSFLIKSEDPTELIKSINSFLE